LQFSFLCFFNGIKLRNNQQTDVAKSTIVVSKRRLFTPFPGMKSAVGMTMVIDLIL